MPFGPFAKKFSPKKSAPRRASSLSTLQGLDKDSLQRELNPHDSANKIRMNLDGNKMLFDGDEWVSETSASGVSQRELNSIKKANEKLKEENNLLQFKLEILLDMLTTSTAEQHLQTKQIDELKNMIRSKGSVKTR